MIRVYGTAGSALGKLSGSVVSGSWSWRSGFHPKANVVAYHKCNRKNFKEKFLVVVESLQALPLGISSGYAVHETPEF
ncbi:MAG TPA: hypothetical protein VFO10_00880 [Oligoflexus sp.]|uniref:hypothetical protein n=1 Tax=Oligoflexus sp. TaxID=1971216 RepID=UPI002D810744|nr:hypothetical protein [Oligoflexus sp.]HET9235769.1 hypothetical protein [Oligoflexus sp.]